MNRRRLPRFLSVVISTCTIVAMIGGAKVPASAAALTCAQGGTCVVGDTGPAGGIVFYVSATVINTASGISNGGLYLEAAPSSYTQASWTGKWCTDTTTMIGTSHLLGEGASNTKAVIDSGLCTTSPMHQAASATIGGYSDWFIPSKEEGDELIKKSSSIGLVDGWFYWQSSESQNWSAKTINQIDGIGRWYSTGASNKNVTNHHYWPIRAFGGVSSPALTPTFDTPVRTSGGFTVNVSNYDANYTWAASASAGTVTQGSASGSTLPLTVTGLSAGAPSTVTVTTTRSGYDDGSATVSGQAKSTQTVTWAPTTAITTLQSPLTPSTSATALDSASITYAVTDAGTTGCTVNTSTGVLTYTGAGSCTVRATAAATSSYLEGTTDVTFSVTKAAQTVTWSPTTSLTTPGTTVTPTAATVPSGGGTITYSVTSAGTTGCSIDGSTGALTYAAIGSCTARASAAESTLYAAGSTDVIFTISRATPTISWSPTTSVEVPDGATTFTAATTSGDGGITYTVTSAGTTGCSLSSSTSRVLSFSAEGSCEVTATAAQTADYLEVTSVKTFAVSKAAQSVTWSPSTSLTLASLTASLGAATTSGDGALTYSVTSAGGTGCAFADSSSPTLTYSGAGSCSVTATAASTTGYAQGTTSTPTTITISLATPTMSWSPTTSWTLPGATVTPGTATATGDGSISYSVTSDTGAGCSVNSSTGALTYTGVGQCEVTASSAATSRYAASSAAETFTISRASQSITAAATSTSLSPGEIATLSSNGSSGSGSVTWSRTSGAGVCTLSGTTVTAVADGSCVLTVSIAADSVYEGASNSLTITVSTPSSGGGGGDGSSSNTTSTPQDPSSVTPSSPGRGEGQGSATGETPQESVPGTGTPTRAIGLPPAPAQVSVTPLAPKTRAKVLVGLPAGAAGASVLSTVVVVRDAKGRVVSRIELPVKKGQQQAEVIVPFLADGYTVNVYNVNEIGVSRGALDASPLVHATTIARRGVTGTPTLFGTELGTPVLFNAGSAWLDPGDQQQLDAIATHAKKSTNRMFITGFARKDGGRASELASLSTRRARAVAMYLAKSGVRVWLRYWGAGTLNGTGQASDRRVEIRTSSAAIPRSLVP